MSKPFENDTFNDDHDGDDDTMPKYLIITVNQKIYSALIQKR